ncbi:MAG: DEAD/DEAH box helicase [Taibaiella sp.]|nr:DEAD/DEAH box helicase [Taibaiella sp.]
MMNFNQFGLKNELVQAVTQLGFTHPSPIQQNTIPLLINNTTDIIALAQTGTGKTAAFGLPLLHKLDPDAPGVQALILSPTRELCMQIKDEMVKYSAFMEDVSIAAVYGGASISEQIRQIKRGVDIIVATPGRLIDLIDRRALFLNDVSTIVLDEADEMLNMGFREDIDRILEVTESREEVWLFSATMNNDVRRIAKKFMDAPQEVAVARENVGNENISHQYYVTQGKYRYEALQRMLDITPDIYGIIFTRTKQDAHDVSEKLVKDGYQVSALHGDLDQNMRRQGNGKI